MKKLLLKIRYIGTNYCGYQVQPNALSIQRRLNEACLSLFGFECDTKTLKKHFFTLLIRQTPQDR